MKTRTRPKGQPASRQVILVGRGVGAPTAERELTRLATQLGRRLERPVRTAMLDHGEQSVHDALDQCRSDSAEEVLVLPVQVPRDRYLETWTRKAIAHWSARDRDGGHAAPAGATAARQTGPPHPGSYDTPAGRTTPARGMTVLVAPSASAPDAMIDAFVSATSGPSEPVTESPASFRSPSWSEITSHARHVLVCQGPRCSAYGGGRVAKQLSAGLRSRGIDDDAVLVTQTGCLVPCNLGPVVVVHPDDVWYTGVDQAAVERIVDEHLRRNRIVDDLRTRRTPSAPDTRDAASVPDITGPEGQRHGAT